MRAVQIEKLLTGIFAKFLKSVTNPDIQKVLKEQSYITGGCIPSMLLGEFVNDYDVYFDTKEAAEKIREHYNVDHEEGDRPFRVVSRTANAITLSDKIQLVTKFAGPAREVTDNFDWAHIKSFYRPSDGKLRLDADIYKLISEKELIYTGSRYPLSSLLRTRKYIKKGWYVSAATMTHIALDCVNTFSTIPQNKQAPLRQLPPLKGGETQPHEELLIDCDTLIEQLNGVDPITIQATLEEMSGKYLTINEIIARLNR
jgi:hypothetical protein